MIKNQYSWINLFFILEVSMETITPNNFFFIKYLIPIFGYIYI